MVLRAPKAEKDTVATQSSSFFNSKNSSLLTREAISSPFFTQSNKNQSNGLIQRSREKESSGTNTGISSVAGSVVQLQTATTPGGPDPCLTLLERIIFLLDELAQRINDALDDRHNLYRDHYRIGDPHPDGHGSWEGHRQRFETDRQDLRDRLRDWDNNCRGFMLSSQQQEEMNEANEYKDKEFPSQPAPSNSRVIEEEPGLSDSVVETLVSIGVPVAVAGTLAGAIVLALADPEPFTKIAALIGTAAAVLFFVIWGDSGSEPEEA